ncbi:hypothetical protein FPG87_02660 [Flavobacterium psychrophilum]|uniref:glycerophosphodiester phosphodiesterase family protein n=1 Tax=Flavobacterium psychrophilum TaxID=96345 RepID=UPI0009034AB0|nr:glycerophosphodiester phosphodiesterase family protein [Flavobacterium psychrophilum]MBF2091561.1 hypothetical protein [Flavobacterium psychrophilum]MEB3380402.1 glycerophosphodiester phosphodiesterase family protein [Flavobacterium psychrophilum]OJH13101.1 hypothetical protein FPG87_02660 [Flavobacterium psychrophilum]SNA75965.1 hypothetical protein DK150_370013 [Flavobacterium psychrophilum]
MSSDNELRVIHNQTIDRATKGFGFVKKKYFRSIKGIRDSNSNRSFKLLNSENVKLIQKEGFQIHTWAVNSPEGITFVQSLLIEGIISNFTDKI